MSVQSQLVSFIQKQRNTGVLLENMYFYWTYSIKRKILSMLGTGYFLKISKITVISSGKNQSVLIAKISSCKTPKSPIRKNKLPQKFRATRYPVAGVQVERGWWGASFKNVSRENEERPYFACSLLSERLKRLLRRLTLYPGGALGYFGGVYAPPGTPNWHSWPPSKKNFP